MSNQKGSIRLELVAIIVIAVAALLYVVVTTKSKEEGRACTEEAKLCPDGSAVGRTGPNCEFAACPQISDETAGWKTYRNEEYGFEFKYPENFVQYNSGPAVILALASSDSCVDQLEKQTGIGYPEGCLYIPVEVTSSNRYQAEGRGAPATFGGISGERFVLNYETATQVRVQANRSNLWYFVAARFHPSYASAESEFNQILSTFRFIE